ncbi:MAG: hypothetical protein K2P23_12790, partial [Lachnospiraceae bacterium]|nr:hypothetical protein [Lachnospiraceae bacterium]
MKKKVVSVLLTAAMLTGLLAGCGSNGGDTQPAADNAADSTQTEAAADTTQTDAAQTEAPADNAADTSADTGEAVTLKWAIWDKDTTPYW